MIEWFEDILLFETGKELAENGGQELVGSHERGRMA
jgi:hypothetical protein